MSYDDWYPTTTSYSVTDYMNFALSAPPKWMNADSGRSLELLRKSDLLSDPKAYLCPSKKGVDAAGPGLSLKGHVSYNWCDGLMGGNCTMSPVACDGTDNHANTGFFLRGDGSVGTANGKKGVSWTTDNIFRDFLYNKSYTDFSF